MKSLKKLFVCASLIAISFMILGVKLNASSYNYNFYKDAIYSSEGLSYKDTLYFSHLFSNSPYGSLSETVNNYYLKKARSNFFSPADISIDTDTSKIYIIDSCETDNSNEAKVQVQTKDGLKTATINKNSAIYVLNDEFKVEYCADIFRISPEVQATLAGYYGLENDPTQFTIDQIQSVKTINQNDRRCPFFSATFDDGATFEVVVALYSAQGIYVRDGYLYIADTSNSRIFRCDINNNYLIDEVYLTPNDVTFYQLSSEEDQSTATVFQPAKIAVDSDGRVYTIATGTYQGIVEYKSDGTFNRFLGKNLVTKRSWWTYLLTEEQYEKLSLNLPSQFTNLVIDDRDLIYATCKPNASSTTVAAQMIKLINTSGTDVLKRNGYVLPDGDINYTKYVKPAVTGSSIFAGVAVNSSRIYSAIDQTRGRIFTYDDEGNLLYISGEKGKLSNTLDTPVGITYFEFGDEEYVLVLDKGSKSLLIYQTTEFGKLVNEATRLYLNNNIDGAKEKWEEVVKMNSNYELGYVGIGKSILRSANTATDTDEKLRLYKESMEMFTLGHNSNYYSSAYKQYRNIILKQNFGLIMTGGVIVIVLGVTLTVYKAVYKKNKVKKEREEAGFND